MLTFWPVPKSNTRVQFDNEAGLIHVEIDQSPFRLLTIPLGSEPYEAVLQKSSAVPILPGWRAPFVVQMAAAGDGT